MIKGSFWNNGVEDHGDAGKVMDFNFVFAHMYCSDMAIDSRVHVSVRAAAFALLDDKHFELYKCRIDNKFFRYYDRRDQSTYPKHQLPDNECSHHFVNEAARIVECVKAVETNSAGVNAIVLLPYLNQLRVALKVLADAFTCCTAIINKLQIYVNDLLSHCLLCAEKIETANRTLQVMNLFLDTAVLYECDLCKEVSADKRFLKPKECCHYSLCNACCVALWKTANTHAKCPACSTSFKSL